MTKQFFLATFLGISVLCSQGCSDDGDSSAAGGQAGSGQAGSGQAGSGQAGSGQAGSGQAGSGQAGSSGGGGAEDQLRTVLFDISGFESHAGQDFHVLIVNELDEVQVGARTMLQGGSSLQISWPGLMPPGGKLKALYWVDVNGDSKCDAPPTDHVWSKDLSGDIYYEGAFTHDTEWTDVCAKIEAYLMNTPGQVGINITAFDPHIDSYLGVALADENGRTVAYMGQKLDKAEATALFFGVMPDKGKVNVYADINGNVKCDAPPTDHVWSLPHTGSEIVNLEHNTDWVDVCSTIHP